MGPGWTSRLRPAGDTCSGARSAASCAGLMAGLRGRAGRARRRAQIGQDVLEAVVAEHRALEAGRADLDAEEVEQVVRADAATSASGLPLISSVSSEALAWLMAQPRPVNPTRSTTPSVTPSISVIRSPHSGLAPS